MTIFNEVGSAGLSASGRSKIYYKKRISNTRSGYGIGMNNNNILKQIELNKIEKPIVFGNFNDLTPISTKPTKMRTYCNISEMCSSGVLPPIVKRWQGQYLP